MRKKEKTGAVRRDGNMLKMQIQKGRVMDREMGRSEATAGWDDEGGIEKM